MRGIQTMLSARPSGELLLLWGRLWRLRLGAARGTILSRTSGNWRCLQRRFHQFLAKARFPLFRVANMVEINAVLIGDVSEHVDVSLVSPRRIQIGFPNYGPRVIYLLFGPQHGFGRWLLRNITVEIRGYAAIDNQRVAVGKSQIARGGVAEISKAKAYSKMHPVVVDSVVRINRCVHDVWLISLGKRLFSYRICILSFCYLITSKVCVSANNDNVITLTQNDGFLKSLVSL